MKHHSMFSILFVAAAIAAPGCSKKDSNKDQPSSASKPTKASPAVTTTEKRGPSVVREAQKPPPAPAMPAGWSVLEDVEFSTDDIARVSKPLGADIAALRNTTYLVNGKHVKINMIVARDKDNGDRLEKKLNTMKAPEFSFRQGNTVFEFVGTDAALPEIRAARAHLIKK